MKIEKFDIEYLNDNEVFVCYDFMKNTLYEIVQFDEAKRINRNNYQYQYLDKYVKYIAVNNNFKMKNIEDALYIFYDEIKKLPNIKDMLTYYKRGGLEEVYYYLTHPFIQINSNTIFSYILNFYKADNKITLKKLLDYYEKRIL